MTSRWAFAVVAAAMGCSGAAGTGDGAARGNAPATSASGQGAAPRADDLGEPPSATSCDAAGCDANAGCAVVDGIAQCECKPGYAGDGRHCDAVAAKLHGLRWEMPCQPHDDRASACNAAKQRIELATEIGGRPGTSYQLTLRFRGVVEQQTYKNGKKDDYWYVGGESGNGNYNIYRLEVSDPPQTYFLNAGAHGIGRCFPIDYTRTIHVNAGARVKLFADAQDGRLITNQDGSKPVIIAGVPPAPATYDGQFIQMDVVSAAGARIELPSEVLFDVDSDVIKPAAREALSGALEKARHARQIVVEGHTDATGALDHNMDLSRRRAAAVARFLAGGGVDRRRVVVKGFGPTRPLAPNDTTEGQQKNRRVEIELRL